MRTPLTAWFHACWLLFAAKSGIRAQHLQRALDIGCFQTAGAMLHRLRQVLVRPGRDRLAGSVGANETYMGDEEPGLRGSRQRGMKVGASISRGSSVTAGVAICTCSRRTLASLADGIVNSLRVCGADLCLRQRGRRLPRETLLNLIHFATWSE